MHVYLPYSSVGKESACNAGDLVLIPPVFLPGESIDRGAWQAIVHGVARVGHDLVTRPNQTMALEILSHLSRA